MKKYIITIVLLIQIYNLKSEGKFIFFDNKKPIYYSYGFNGQIIKFKHTNSKWIFNFSNEKIYESNDNGITWRKINITNQIKANKDVKSINYLDPINNSKIIDLQNYFGIYLKKIIFEDGSYEIQKLYK